MELAEQGMTPAEWMAFNYGVTIGGEVTLFNGKKVTIKEIKEADNIGHYRTMYPVVAGIDVSDNLLPEKIEWITLESIYKC